MSQQAAATCSAVAAAGVFAEAAEGVGLGVDEDDDVDVCQLTGFDFLKMARGVLLASGGGLWQCSGRTGRGVVTNVYHTRVEPVYEYQGWLGRCWGDCVPLQAAKWSDAIGWSDTCYTVSLCCLATGCSLQYRLQRNSAGTMDKRPHHDKQDTTAAAHD